MMKDNNPWFVAKDLCDILDITWSGTVSLGGISVKNKGILKFKTPGGMQDLLVVSEPGMYRLIMRSTKAEAEKFQDWIAEEVLPSIRQHGMYLAPAIAKEAVEDPEVFLARAADWMKMRWVYPTSLIQLEENKK